MPEKAHLETMTRLACEIEPDAPEMREWCGLYAEHHLLRLARDLSIISRDLPEGRLLDVGAVPPYVLAAMAEAGREAVGIDVDPERFRSYLDSKGLDVRACDIEREPLPFEDGSFGAVIFNEVFEHLRQDLVFSVSELARVLRPGGRLMLTTPNMRSARGIISLVVRGRSAFLCPDLHREYGKLRTLGHMGHVREYTARDVTELCAHAGLRPVRTIWRAGSKESWKERLVCNAVPALRPYMTIIFERAGSM